MSTQPDSLWRGCAANFPQPVTEEDALGAQFLVETVYYFNCRLANPSLPDIEYRSSSREADIVRHVFRWDITHYLDVFRDGFHSRRQEGIPDDVYFSLDHYVHQGGRPLSTQRPTSHAFVSTTLNSAWHPSVNPVTTIDVYRYEIYAPGGIWVAQTLGDSYRYPGQDEVCFVAGIAPQYIRSAQLFRLSTANGTRFPRRERVDNVIRINANFNPQSDSSRELRLQRPICVYINATGTRTPLNRDVCGGSDNSNREKRNANTVANSESVYINAAFRSSRSNEAYLFMDNEYVLLNYAPGTTDDSVVNGPLLICDGFPSLTGTAFSEHGIDSAFGSHDTDEAFIFSSNLCARINYAPGTTDDKIIKGPMTIAAMFPFLKGTVFESSVDAAFEATTKYEAYLFKDDRYALINYNASHSHLIAVRLIKEGFPSLKDTFFASGVDAAFASHRKNEAYLFKGDSYALINFAPGTTDDYIIGGVKPILPNWHSLSTILPRDNRGIDVHDHTKPDADRDHDELLKDYRFGSFC